MLAIKRLPKRRDPRMELSAYALHVDAALVLCRAATECAKVRGVLTRGTTITFSHRLAAASRPLPGKAIGSKLSK
jgi:hypothetical protein